jgi:tellurite resistance protein
MSAWVLALGLSAGFLVRQNLAMQKRLEIASSQVEECNKTEATKEIRKVKKSIPLADQFSEMNVQLPASDQRYLQKEQESALERVSVFESPPVMPEIQGVWLDSRGP